MSLRYKILGNPQTVEDLVQYAIKKSISDIDIKTGKEFKEETLVWWEGSLTLTCGDKQIKLDKVYTSSYSGKLGYYGIEGSANTTDKATLKEAEKKAKYIKSQGLKAIINGTPFEG